MSAGCKQFKIRLPVALHAELARLAAANNRSIGAEFVHRLSASLVIMRTEAEIQALPAPLDKETAERLIKALEAYVARQ